MCPVGEIEVHASPWQSQWRVLHTHLQELDHLLSSHVNHVPQDHRKLLRSLSPLQQKQQLNLREAQGDKEGGIEGGKEGDRKNGEKD